MLRLLSKKYRTQFLALLCGAILMGVSGMHMGWGLLNLQFSELSWIINASDAQFTMSLASWHMGTFVGAFAASIFVKHFRKFTLMVSLSVFR